MVADHLNMSSPIGPAVQDSISGSSLKLVRSYEWEEDVVVRLLGSLEIGNK